MINRRRFAAIAASSALAPAFGGAPALAQLWPARPVRFVVPFPPGSPPDVACRLIAARISEM